MIAGPETDVQSPMTLLKANALDLVCSDSVKFLHESSCIAFTVAVLSFSIKVDGP